MIPHPARRGLLLVLSSPSGAGKSTIARALLRQDRTLRLSVSCTTRPRRPGEKDGRDYFFLTPGQFREKQQEGLFLEHAVVFGHYYGTLKSGVLPFLEKGRDILFDLDWQGRNQIAEAAPGDVISVFVLPPSRDILYQRLSGRGQDGEDVIATRMAAASREISHWSDYDYIVVNDVLDQCVARILAVLETERLRRWRNNGNLASFAEALQASTAAPDDATDA